MTTDLTTAEFWDRRWDTAELGSTQRGFSQREFLRLAQDVLHEVPDGGTMLEVGAAPGTFMRQYSLLRPDLRLHGIDISRDGVGIAKAMLEREGISATFMVDDLRSDTAREWWNSFDIVCSHGLIEHFENWREILEAHFRFARPGGRIFVTVPNYSNVVVRMLLKWFAAETLATHNLDCMSEKMLRTVRIESACTLGPDRVGGYGGPLFPSSAVNANFGGSLYRLFAQVWNGSVGIVAWATGDRLILRPWNGGLYLIGSRGVGSENDESRGFGFASFSDLS